MYAVVGCRDCGALWIVEGRPETTGCPRCGTRHRFDRLKAFVETDDEDRARQARAAMLADRSGHGDAFDDLDSYAEMADRVDDAGIDDDEYLDGLGLDPDAVEAAATPDDGESLDRREAVRAAIGDLDHPDESAVIEYARRHDVAAEDARAVLEKLVRAGEVSESGGRYRLL